MLKKMTNSSNVFLCKPLVCAVRFVTRFTLTDLFMDRASSAQWERLWLRINDRPDANHTDQTWKHNDRTEPIETASNGEATSTNNGIVSLVIAPAKPNMVIVYIYYISQWSPPMNE